MLVEWKSTPPPALETVRGQASDLWKNAQFRIFVERQLWQLEEKASIHLIGGAPAAATPGDQSVFDDMLEKTPASPVARLGVFWRLAQANDPGAAAALGKVLEGPSLGIAARNALAAALRARGHHELAARCRPRQ